MNMNHFIIKNMYSPHGPLAQDLLELLAVQQTVAVLDATTILLFSRVYSIV